MKKLRLLTIVSFCYSSTFAQGLIISLPDNPACSYRPWYLDTTGINEGSDGSDQVWEEVKWEYRYTDRQRSDTTECDVHY